jgi:hypothetical protein
VTLIRFLELQSGGRRARWGLSCLILTLLLLSTTGVQAGAAPDAPDLATTVSLQRSAEAVQGCGTATVDIWINGVTGLYGADVRVRFDPTMLQVVDANASTPFVQIQALGGFLQTNFVIKKLACNALEPTNPDCDEPEEVGMIWYADSQINPTPPVSGSGAIARITFRGLAAGASNLTIIYHKLSNNNGVEIPASASDNTLGAVAPAMTSVNIAWPTATTARLSWDAAAGVANYNIYRDSAPYFTPVAPPFTTTAALSYDDLNALGSTTAEYYYVVRSSCSNGFESLASNRTGAFDYDLLLEP